MALIGYARATDSAKAGARLDDQVGALTDAGVDPGRIYTDQGEHPGEGLDAAIAALSKGDQLVTASISPLAYSPQRMLRILERIEAAGGSLLALKPRMDTSTEEGQRLLGVVHAMAEAESEFTTTRSQKALDARGPGQQGGRRRKLADAQVAAARRRIEGGATVTEVAKELGVSRATLHRYLAG